MSPEQILNFSTEHEGVCYKTEKNYNVSNAEEFQAIELARDLLLDESGNYRGDDVAIAPSGIHADQDTRSPSKFIREQNRIIGAAADNHADHVRDKGHIIKCINNEFFDLKKKDKSFAGKDRLTNLMILRINLDVRKIVDAYEDAGIGNATHRKACLDQLDAVIPHHCGDHSLCKCENFCTHLKVRKRHPTWSKDQVAMQAASELKRNTNMSLSPRGIAIVIAVLKKRFNEKTIDNMARGGCSNLSESFWNVNTKFSEGKRLNLDLTDAWIIVNKLTFCRIGEGNVAKTHDEVSDKMCLPITSQELLFQTVAGKKRARDKARQSTPAF